jgi:hypothetical protein
VELGFRPHIARRRRHRSGEVKIVDGQDNADYILEFILPYNNGIFAAGILLKSQQELA